MSKRNDLKVAVALEAFLSIVKTLDLNPSELTTIITTLSDSLAATIKAFKEKDEQRKSS